MYAEAMDLSSIGFIPALECMVFKEVVSPVSAMKVTLIVTASLISEGSDTSTKRS